MIAVIFEVWRQFEAYRAVQSEGRQGVFDDYGLHEREQAPPDSRCRHHPSA